MITVAIYINGCPILVRSAVNQLHEDEDGLTMYEVDDGTILRHKPDDGAVDLARAMLDTIVDPRAVPLQSMAALRHCQERLRREEKQNRP